MCSCGLYWIAYPLQCLLVRRHCKLSALHVCARSASQILYIDFTPLYHSVPTAAKLDAVEIWTCMCKIWWVELSCLDRLQSSWWVIDLPQTCKAHCLIPHSSPVGQHKGLWSSSKSHVKLLSAGQIHLICYTPFSCFSWESLHSEYRIELHGPNGRLHHHEPSLPLDSSGLACKAIFAVIDLEEFSPCPSLRHLIKNTICFPRSIIKWHWLDFMHAFGEPTS